MDNVISIKSHKPNPPSIEIKVHAFEIQNRLSTTIVEAMNDRFYISLAEDPIWFIESHTQNDIWDALDTLSKTSTKGYIKSFMTSISYMTDFESKAWNLFMLYWNKNQKIIMALIYLIAYPKISIDLYNYLLSILSSCTHQEALSARNIMINIWLVWTENELDDTILSQFLTKAAYAEHGLQKVV